MPTKKQLSQLMESQFAYPETRRKDDPMYKKPNNPPTPPQEDKSAEEVFDIFKQERTDALSKMFDNKYDNGIYPTSVFFDEIDTACKKAIHQHTNSQTKKLREALEGLTYAVERGYDVKQALLIANETLNQINKP